MIENITQARDEIIGVTTAAWPLAADRLFFWDVPHDPPVDGSWARVTVRHLTGGSASLGTRLQERRGRVTVQLFCEVGDGLTTADSLAETLQKAYEGASSSCGILFRNVVAQEIGPDGRWFNMNVLADFEYTMVRNG